MKRFINCRSCRAGKLGCPPASGQRGGPGVVRVVAELAVTCWGNSGFRVYRYTLSYTYTYTCDRSSEHVSGPIILQFNLRQVLVQDAALVLPQRQQVEIDFPKGDGALGYAEFSRPVFIKP